MPWAIKPAFPRRATKFSIVLRLNKKSFATTSNTFVSSIAAKIREYAKLNAPLSPMFSTILSNAEPSIRLPLITELRERHLFAQLNEHIARQHHQLRPNCYAELLGAALDAKDLDYPDVKVDWMAESFNGPPAYKEIIGLYLACLRRDLPAISSYHLSPTSVADWLNAAAYAHLAKDDFEGFKSYIEMNSKFQLVLGENIIDSLPSARLHYPLIKYFERNQGDQSRTKKLYQWYLNRLSRLPSPLLYDEFCNVTRPFLSLFNASVNVVDRNKYDFSKADDKLEGIDVLREQFTNYVRHIIQRKGSGAADDLDYLKKVITFSSRMSGKTCAVVDHLNYLHRTAPKVKPFLDLGFDAVIFATRGSKRNVRGTKSLANQNVLVVWFSKDCQDDIFIILCALYYGPNAFIVSNDLFRDFRLDFASYLREHGPGELKLTLNEYLDKRGLRHSQEGKVIQNPLIRSLRPQLIDENRLFLPVTPKNVSDPHTCYEVSLDGKVEKKPKISPNRPKQLRSTTNTLAS